MTNSEWIEAYRSLLQSLREIPVDSSFISAIEEAASARIEEEVTEDIELFQQFDRESRNNLDSTRLRPPTPQESFVAAVGVLITRLREVPALAKRVAIRLDHDISDIQWKSDTPQNQASEEEYFSASDLQLASDEMEQIETRLRQFERLLDINSNDNIKRFTRYD